MKKTLLSLLFVSTLFLTSCKKELEPQESSTDTTAVASTPADPNAANPAVVNPTAVDPSQAIQVQPNQPTQANTATTQPQVLPTAKGMNPPHGQPGHRCDIAVGAPLNSPVKSAAGQTATPQAVTSQTVKPSTLTPAYNTSVPSTIAAPQTVETLPGMNPPHGQAGHDCAVAVGAPLPKKE